MSKPVRCYTACLWLIVNVATGAMETRVTSSRHVNRAHSMERSLGVVWGLIATAESHESYEAAKASLTHFEDVRTLVSRGLYKP